VTSASFGVVFSIHVAATYGSVYSMIQITPKKIPVKELPFVKLFIHAINWLDPFRNQITVLCFTSEQRRICSQISKFLDREPLPALEKLIVVDPVRVGPVPIGHYQPPSITSLHVYKPFLNAKQKSGETHMPSPSRFLTYVKLPHISWLRMGTVPSYLTSFATRLISNNKGDQEDDKSFKMLSKHTSFEYHLTSLH